MFAGGAPGEAPAMAQLMSTVARAVGTMSIKQMHTAIQEVRTEGEETGGEKRKSIQMISAIQM